MYICLVTDSGECFVFHIFSAGIIMFTRHIQWCYNFDQQTCERHDLVAWRLCSLFAASNFIQPNKPEMQKWLDEEVVQNFTLSAVKSLLEPCFWPQVSLICQRSWNVLEQICDAHSLKACAQLLPFTVCAVCIPVYSLGRQWGSLMLQGVWTSLPCPAYYMADGYCLNIHCLEVDVCHCIQPGEKGGVYDNPKFVHWGSWSFIRSERSPESRYVTIFII